MGFLYQYRPEMMFDYSEMERTELFDTLWKMVSWVAEFLKMGTI